MRPAGEQHQAARRSLAPEMLIHPPGIRQVRTLGQWLTKDEPDSCRPVRVRRDGSPELAEIAINKAGRGQAMTQIRAG